MSAFITLSNLAWSTPDGRSLFEDLDLSVGRERLGLVGRNGVGKTTLLNVIAGAAQPRSGSVQVQGRIAVLRQLVHVDPSETVGHLFGVHDALSLLQRAEAGTATPEDIARADWTLETRLGAALATAGLDVSPGTLLATLSGGQRTRAALAAAMFGEPDLILLDEPTNNLDREGRTIVREMLGGWRAGALVVSHDRELLEGMEGILELSPLGLRRYGGGWSAYRERKSVELAAAQQDLAEADRKLALAERTAQANAERKAARDGAGQRKAARGGQPRIVLGMMKNRAELSGGDQARTAQRRREQAQAAASAAREKIEVLQPFVVELPSTGLPPQKTVLSLEGVWAGYQPNQPVVRDVNLAIVGPERIALSGPNGSGKTTLLRLIRGELTPLAGAVRTPAAFALLDQRVDLLDPALSVRDNFKRLHPSLDETACRAALARFMFRADAALQTAGALSGGQLLRAGLACVLGGEPPPLLILDEPTNHLDLESIEAVQAGLAAYDGALLVVSHDEPFLEAIGVTRRLELTRDGRLA